MMPISRGFISFSKLILLNVFLVILAGGVVRMTQSGMGCPDWPTCFGRWIPPTSESQLPQNYKEIYAFKYVDTSFNVYHTWIEYVNRLLGAILGLLLFIQFIWSLKFRNSRRNITWLCFSILVLTGFQGWLGSKVVEANLEVAKITMHMLIALVIAALAYKIIYETIAVRALVVNKALKRMSLITIIILLVQIILGTEVREQIDHISLTMKFESRERWIEQLDIIFLVHRSFSLIVAGLCFYLCFKFRKYEAVKLLLYFSTLLVLLIISLGVLMNYFSIPALAQPLHLLLSSILVIVLYGIFLKTKVGVNDEAMTNGR